MVYKTQSSKLKDFLNWIIEDKSDGSWYRLDQLLSKISIEKGFKKEKVLDMLKDFEVIGRVKLDLISDPQAVSFTSKEAMKRRDDAVREVKEFTKQENSKKENVKKENGKKSK